MDDIEKVARGICIAMFGYDCVPNDGNLLAEPGSRLATVLRAAEAAIAAMQPAPQWQGIESAPRDGGEILLWPAIRRPVERKVPCAVGRWSRYPGMECWDDLTVGHHNGLWKPTHWTPLPSGPAGGSDAE